MVSRTPSLLSSYMSNSCLIVAEVLGDLAASVAIEESTVFDFGDGVLVVSGVS